MSTQNFLIVGLIVVVCGGIIYWFVKKKPDSAGDGDPMPVGTRRLLAVYLLLFGFTLMFLLWQVGTVDFSEAALRIDSAILTPATAPPTSTSTAVAGDAATNEKRPILSKLFPQVSGGGGVPVVYVTACGGDFENTSKLRFNQKEQPTIFVDSTRLQAQLDQSIIDAASPISVDVVTKDPTSGKDQVTDTFGMTVYKGRLPVDLIFGHLQLTRELQLLLLAMLAGALGSFVHALKSFSDFVGNRTLTASWFWWYITRPFLGAALAVIFYAVLRGGFMAGTAADAKAVNQFGVVAVGALVGMFADKASDKLAEIFDTLFKGSDTRGGKLAAPVIDKLDPDNFTAGAASGTFKIKGDRLADVKQVKFDGVEHPHGTPSDKEISVDLTANDLSQKKIIKVSVSGDNGESPTKGLEIK